MATNDDGDNIEDDDDDDDEEDDDNDDGDGDRCGFLCTILVLWFSVRFLS